jgi:hypothetical protein
MGGVRLRYARASDAAANKLAQFTFLDQRRDFGLRRGGLS